MKSLILTIIFLFLLAKYLNMETDFKPDPVYEHFRLYGKGVDFSYVPADKVPNRNLKRKEGE